MSRHINKIVLLALILLAALMAIQVGAQRGSVSGRGGYGGGGGRGYGLGRGVYQGLAGYAIANSAANHGIYGLSGQKSRHWDDDDDE